MENNLNLLKPEEEKNYNFYLEKNPQATFEYTTLWRNILEKNFGFKPYYIISKGKEGRINGALPLFLAKSIFGKRLVSTPYAVYTGMLADNEEVLGELIDFARDLAIKERVDFLEIREKEEKSFPSDFKLRKQIFNFSLALSSNPEEIRKKLPKGSIRWGIKIAQKSGLTWHCGNSLMDLKEFYKLFVLTRKFRGVPGYHYSYFKDIINGFKNSVKIYTAKLGGKPIASIFLIYHKKEVRYAFAGAIPKKEFLRLQPYHLILWEAIKDACQRGYELFNLGGATLKTNDGGLYEFKKKWAHIVLEVPSYFYLNKAKDLPKTDNNAIFKMASGVWKKLPVSLIKLLSPKVIKQFV